MNFYVIFCSTGETITTLKVSNMEERQLMVVSVKKLNYESMFYLLKRRGNGTSEERLASSPSCNRSRDNISRAQIFCSRWS